MTEGEDKECISRHDFWFICEIMGKKDRAEEICSSL